MTRLITCFAGAALAVSMAAAATPSYAGPPNFADFHQTTAVDGVHWIRTQVGSENSRARNEGGRLFTENSASAHIGDAAGELPTSFSFLDPTLNSLVGGSLQAGFILDATVTPSTSGAFTDAGGNLVQDHVSGSFAFIYRGAAPISDGMTTLSNGDVLLSAVFHDASLSGPAGGATIDFDDSTFSGLGNTIDYFSPLLDFSASNPDPGHLITGRDFAIALDINAAGFALGVGPGTTCTVGVGPCAQTFNNFDANASGTMGASGMRPVPEPSTWSLMILGFGGVAALLRAARRRLAPTSV